MKLTITKYIALAAMAIAPSIAAAATMSVSPASQSVKVGDVFNVSIKLDTQGASIDGVDIRYLTFNPAVLQVQDGDPKAPDTQISADNLMALTVLNTANNSQGKITFSQVATGGTKFKGSGTLATVQFKAIAPGNSSLVFSHTPKNTTDTNVASAGTDILSNVINGSYVVTGKAGKAVATPAIQSPATNPTQTVSATPPVTPDTDTTEFEYQKPLTFWQALKKMIGDYFSGFFKRLKGEAPAK